MKRALIWFAQVVLFLSPCVVAQESPPVEKSGPPPNIVIILSDDAGYADFSMHGSESVPTPRIDSIAREGVLCSNGYVSASVCSPSRAGLMTGRYQQRFGHETNIPPRFSETNGLPITETTIADVMKSGGYRTIGLGKWHLGYADHFHPMSRGFTDWYGFLQGARSFWAMEGTRLNRLLHDRKPVKESFDYMTDELGRQAAEYIKQTTGKPFFLYLAFNAVHTPMHATKQDLAAVQGQHKPRRKKLIAMTMALDRAVGQVLDALDEQGLTKDTLVVFINDNGGATNNASRNTPLRGTKGTPFEGGHRIPFALRWPGVLPAAKVYHHPVSTLDLLPTASSAAGLNPECKNKWDGVDLLPYLKGNQSGRPHETLYWRLGTAWAIRHRDMKLVYQKKTNRKTKEAIEIGPLLFDLAIDPGETCDLAKDRPEEVQRLNALYQAWEKELAKPLW